MEKFKFMIAVPGYFDYHKGVVSFWKEVSYADYKNYKLKGELVKKLPLH